MIKTKTEPSVDRIGFIGIICKKYRWIAMSYWIHDNICNENITYFKKYQKTIVKKIGFFFDIIKEIKTKRKKEDNTIFLAKKIDLSVVNNSKLRLTHGLDSKFKKGLWGTFKIFWILRSAITSMIRK